MPMPLATRETNTSSISTVSTRRRWGRSERTLSTLSESSANQPELQGLRFPLLAGSVHDDSEPDRQGGQGEE